MGSLISLIFLFICFSKFCKIIHQNFHFKSLSDNILENSETNRPLSPSFECICVDIPLLPA